MPLVHEELRERLRAMIGAQWMSGQRLPPIKQLAQQLGAGHVNTHRAVRQLVDEGLLISRPRRGTVVSERLPERGGPTGPLAGKTVVILGTATGGDPFLGPLVQALEQQLGAGGATCRLGPRLQPGEEYTPAHYPEADAIVFLNPRLDLRFRANGRQAFLIISTSQDHVLDAEDGYDMVMADSEQGGYLAGRHLLATGARQVCFIGVPPLWPQPADRPADCPGYDITSGLRLRGFELGYGRPVPFALRLQSPDYHSHCGAKLVPAFLALPTKPDALFCASDDLATGFAHGALAHGLLPGKDFQLIGFDGQQRAREVIPGGLTTIGLNHAAMARTACDLLATRLGDLTRPVTRVQLAGMLLPGASTHLS